MKRPLLRDGSVARRFAEYVAKHPEGVAVPDLPPSVGTDVSYLYKAAGSLWDRGYLSKERGRTERGEKPATVYKPTPRLLQALRSSETQGGD